MNSYSYFKAQLNGCLSFGFPSLGSHSASHFVLYSFSPWPLDQEGDLLKVSNKRLTSYFPKYFHTL